jgi:uncharacterized protein YciI
MQTFAVFRRRTSVWDDAHSLEQQREWAAHADYMMALAGEGFVLLAGPMGERQGALIIVRAESEKEVEARFADDPWTRIGLLETDWIAPWEIRIGTLA